MSYLRECVVNCDLIALITRFSLIEFRVPYKSSAYKIIVDDVTNSIFKAGDVSDFVGKAMKNSGKESICRS
jgi:hypothetical protein